MPPPHLPDLLIEGYRGLRRLELKKLGHVNLIVGRNGVGKTSVLEAVRLYASPRLAKTITEIATERDEADSGGEPIKVSTATLASFFLGRPDIRKHTAVFSVGALANPARFSIEWTVFEDGEPRVVSFDQISGTEPASRTLLKSQQGWGTHFLHLDVQTRHGFLPITELTLFSELADDAPLRKAEVVLSKGVPNSQFALLWDKIVLTPDEDRLNAALSHLLPDITRIALTQEPGRSQRLAYARLRNSDERVPIRSLGDGMSRFLAIALALVNARDGFLLIDEFENGLHYTTQESLWKFIIQTARELNVQVFATTHSRDCIAAFGRATKADPQSSGMLFRLEQFNGEIVETHFDESEIATVTENLIEVR